MKNAKTTLAGLLTGLGLFFTHSANATLATIGQIASVVGSVLMGHSAADKTKKP